MLHPILYVLDNEIESRQFERLCTDLMYRTGYTEIEPYGGTHDRGRDAESLLFKGTASTGGTVIFQYSQEARWERKLLKELMKVKQNEHKIIGFVFVSSRSVTGAKRDELKRFVQKQYGWVLTIFEREWLRLQLEEAHPHLAIKYLGIDPAASQSLSPIPSKPTSSTEDPEEKAWKLYRDEDYDGAAVEFKKWLAKHGNDLLAWQALAWCQYRLYRYQEALVSITKALALDRESQASLTIQASILTEDGIARESRPNLLLAKGIFARIAKTSNQWVDHYNYANVLSGLGEYDVARDEFLKAISLNPNQPMVWKNLSSTWAYLGNHKEEVKCLDTALRLNPRLPEALVSQGTRLMAQSKNVDEAVALMERAISEDETTPVRWPHLYYWLAIGYHALGKLQTALDRIDSGLSIVPHHAGLLDMKGRVLAEAWRKDRSFLPQAKTYFLFLVEASPGNYPPVEELARVLDAAEGKDAAWNLLDEYVKLPSDHAASAYLKMVGYTLNDVLIGLRFIKMSRSFREQSRIYDFVDKLREHNITKDDAFRDALFLTCTVSFGLVCDQFAATPKSERKLSRVKSIYKAASATLERVIPRLSSLLSPGVVMESPETIADGIARILLALYHIALLEVSGQVGYAAGLFQVDGKMVEKAMPHGKEINEWLARINAETLLLLNTDLHFAPE